MATDLSSIRTLQDVINVLSVIYFNMNEIERIYYDMYLNPVPMDVEFQRYNDLGTLETILLPNRAKDRDTVLSGYGSPEGKVSAGPASFYLDLTGLNLYYKSVGLGASGWIKVYSTNNLQENIDYLRPNGDASQLTNLNVNNVSSGILAVGKGGTGGTGVSGLVKGNGSSAYTAAVDGVDYMGPAAMTGVIAYFPVRFLPDGTSDAIPKGWLRCDGSAYSRSTYNRLFNIIGTTYGNGDGSTTFNIPNLYNYFIRGWDGTTPFNTVQQDQVGKHTHTLTGTTGEESAHTHTAGNFTLTGSAGKFWASSDIQSSGCFSIDTVTGGVPAGAQAYIALTTLNLNAENNISGTTSGGSAHSHTLTGQTAENTTSSGTAETRVLNKMLIPIIKF